MERKDFLIIGKKIGLGLVIYIFPVIIIAGGLLLLNQLF